MKNTFARTALALALVVISIALVSGCSIAGAAMENKPESEPESETTANVLDNDVPINEEYFDDNIIIVYIDQDYMRDNNLSITPEFFPEINCIKVEEDNRGFYNYIAYELTIEEHSKAKVLEGVAKLNERDDIYKATTNGPERHTSDLPPKK